MTSTSETLQWTGPIPTRCPETEPFWQGCAEGHFLVQTCNQCGKTQYPYRALCCHCWSSDVRSVPALGTGHVWTYSVVKRCRTPPFDSWGTYVVAVIELSEGVKVVSNIVGGDPDSVHIGMPVRLAFASAGDKGSVPVFVADISAGQRS